MVLVHQLSTDQPEPTSLSRQPWHCLRQHTGGRCALPEQPCQWPSQGQAPVPDM